MKIRNWGKFQHFKDRRPPWIKLHRDILDQRDIMMISACSFRLLTCLWLLASEDESMEGNLPSIPDISFRLRMPEKEITQCLKELMLWVEQDDNELISTRYQDGSPETETETYKEETEKSVAQVKPSRPLHKKTDEEWIEEIKNNPAYQGMNFDIEIGKAQAWCMTKGKKCSRAFLLNWFNRAEKNTSLVGTQVKVGPVTFSAQMAKERRQAMINFVNGGDDSEQLEAGPSSILSING